MVKLSENFIFADRYELLRLLGRGGFSEVWLAEDEETGIKVAIKIYAPGTGLDDEGIETFRKEFSLVFDMNHTNLLRPSFYDQWERMPYLILPYCSKGSAFKYLKDNVNLEEDECWHLLHDVAAGLAYLHSQNPPVIHQDIKPDNILIDDQGRYMITDFGISARVRSTFKEATEQSGGTLAYMGPERFSSQPIPTMASDVWSMGAMMFELMTCGNPPFGNHGGLLQKSGAEIPIIEESFSQELKDIIYRCLALNTWDRPTADEIEQYTYAHIHGFNTIPQPPKPESAWWKKWHVLVGVLLVTLTIVVIAVMLWKRKGSKDELPERQQQEITKEAVEQSELYQDKDAQKVNASVSYIGLYAQADSIYTSEAMTEEDRQVNLRKALPIFEQALSAAKRANDQEYVKRTQERIARVKKRMK